MKQGMLYSMTLVAFMACNAIAQTPAEQLIGTWLGTTGICGPATFKFSKVEANGVVRGTLDCSNRNIVFVLGETTEFNKSMAATLKGQNLDIVGANNTGFQLVLEGRKLSGFGLRGASDKVALTPFVKQ